MCPPPRRPVQRQNDLPSWLLHLQYTKCLPGRGAGNEVEKNFVAFFLALVEERHAEQKQLVDQAGGAAEPLREGEGAAASARRTACAAPCAWSRTSHMSCFDDMQWRDFCERIRQDWV
mmetsp:Transcript_3418/g.5126  ORF Transcript_3418/g.5126 Transcript_3418/m.5126 type:complete len:118 (+) Transcript_3418:84-437(+)